MTGKHVEDALYAIAEPPGALRPESVQRLVGANGRGEQPEGVRGDKKNATPALAELGRRAHDVIEQPELRSYRLLPPELLPTGDDLDLGPLLVQQGRGLQRGLPGANYRHSLAAEVV